MSRAAQTVDSHLSNTSEREKTGKGTSLAMTTSRFAEKRNTFAIPGSRKYMPISTLPIKKRLIDISINYSY